MAVVKAQASISLAQVNDGTNGKDGAAGKDITSYAKGTALPTTVAAANSQFWLLNSSGQCTAVYVSDGSKWVATHISASLIVAATFKGMNFEGVSFTGSEFNTTYTNVANTVGDRGTKFTGTGTLSGPELVFDSMTDDTTPQAVRTAMAPEGFSAYAGDNAFGYFSAFGQMALGDANGLSGSLTAEMLEQMNNSGKVLWQGGMWMANGQSITPPVSLDDCFNGWILLWSRYTNGATSDAQFVASLVPKYYAQMYSGKGMNFPLSTFSTNKTVTKMLYITNTTISGHATNGVSPQNEFALRAVLAN